VATTKSQRKLFFNLRKMKKNLAWLSEAETAAVARDLGVDVADVREMEQRLSARDMSFDPTPGKATKRKLTAPAMYLAGQQCRSGHRGRARGMGEEVQRSLGTGARETR